MWENGLPRMGYSPVLLTMDTTGTRQSGPLFIGTNRYVAALHTKTGDELWRTKLPHAGGCIVSLVLEKTGLYAGHAGHVYSIDPRMGSILWENGLPKMGYHAVSAQMQTDIIIISTHTRISCFF